MTTSNSTGKSRRRNSFHSKISQLIVNYKTWWQRQIRLENQDDKTRFIPRLLSWSWIIKIDGNVKFDWKSTSKLVSFQDYQLIVNYKTRWQRQIRLENQDEETRFIPRLLSWSWIIRTRWQRQIRLENHWRRRNSFHSKISQLIVNYKTRWQRQIRLENQDDKTRLIPRLLSWSWIIRKWQRQICGKSRRRNSFHSKITQLIVNYKMATSNSTGKSRRRNSFQD